MKILGVQIGIVDNTILVYGLVQKTSICLTKFQQHIGERASEAVFIALNVDKNNNIQTS